MSPESVGKYSHKRTHNCRSVWLDADAHREHAAEVSMDGRADPSFLAVATSIEGRRLEIARPHDHPHQRECFIATIVTEGPQASALVWEQPWNESLAAFFKALANDWNGWSGDRSWSSAEGDLAVIARHDGKGLVVCSVTLHTLDESWSLTTRMAFGAGAHMDEIAGNIERALM